MKTTTKTRSPVPESARLVSQNYILHCFPWNACESNGDGYREASVCMQSNLNAQYKIISQVYNGVSCLTR